MSPGTLGVSSSAVHNFYGVLQVTPDQFTQRLLTGPIPAQGRYFIHGTANLSRTTLTLRAGTQFIVAQTGALWLNDSFRIYQQNGESFFHNYGEVVVDETAGVRIDVPFQNYGTLRISSGTLNVYSFNSAGDIHFGPTGRLLFSANANLMASCSVQGFAKLECNSVANVGISSQFVEIEVLELYSCTMTFETGVNFTTSISRIEAVSSSSLTIRQQSDVLRLLSLIVQGSGAVRIETQANIDRYGFNMYMHVFFFHILRAMLIHNIIIRTFALINCEFGTCFLHYVSMYLLNISLKI